MRTINPNTLIPVFALTLAAQLASAQDEDDARYEIHAPSAVATTSVANAAVVSPTQRTAPTRVVLPVAPAPVGGGNYTLQFLGGINPKDAVLDSIKRVKNALTADEGAMDRRSDDPGGAKAGTPDLGYSFDSNTQSYSWPMDNSLAISDQDVIVAASNGGVMIHRYDGTLLASYTWTQFAGEPCFDPRVFYDAVDNRFVMVALHGNTPATSKLKVLFSSSIDPLQPWHMYDITAASVSNHIGSGKWFDYPTLGLSEDEVFVSVDVRNSGFVENVVFQMDHSDGYAGSMMNWVIWTGISNSPFATYHLTAAPNGWSGRMSKGQYFVLSSSSGGSSVRVFRITEKIGNNPVMNSWTVGTASYAAPADAHMPGTAKRLDIGSCAVRGAYYLSGYLHMVFSTENSASVGKIRYVRVATSGMTAQSSTFHSSADNYLAYPTVIPYNNADHGGPNSNAIIGFLVSNNTNKYPSISVVNCDESMTWSGSVGVRSGTTYIEYTTDNVQRWGDYIGMCREHSVADEPRVWIAGAYAVSGHVYRARIAQVGLGSVTGVDEPTTNTPFAEGALFPNPAHGPVTLDVVFDADEPLVVELVAMDGTRVRTIYQGIPRSGRNRITFDSSDVAPGLYMVVARTSSTVLGSLRFIAQ
ncbi:MAG TPA: hypothetical protein PKE21_05825 [Flavobacteriales bacterium]|nr:hypothetical protein [Flavobacteriales bacterium]HMR26976.1 hypothetical protein [Flavobacteriales bacterium]